MDFEWSDEDQAYRADVRASLARIVDPDRGRYRASLEHSAESSRAVCGVLAGAGHLVPHWPEEYGGSGDSPWRQMILAEEMWRVGEPRAPQYLNVNFIGPAILRFGTDEQRRRYLPNIVAGRALWCQGFSEPEAGSDLSRIRTTATPVAGGWSIRGVKLWISYADVAEHCFLLTRVSEDLGRASHQGRTLFLVDMSTPGITVTEVPSIVGSHVFHEVRFDDVFVPADTVLGQPGEGWSIVRAALADERAGAPEYMQAEAALDAALSEGGGGDDVALGRAYVRCAGARLLAYELVSQRCHGIQSPNAGAARSYLHRARLAAAEALDDRLVEAGHDARSDGVEALNAIIGGIAGGAYEVLLDVSTRTRAESS